MPILDIDPNIQMASASVAGATVGWLADQKNKTKQKNVEGAIGAITGIALGPAIADWLGTTKEASLIAVGFLTALCGLGIVTFVLDWARGDGLKTWLSRWLPHPPGGNL